MAAPKTLQLLDFNDSDLFYALEDAYDEEGWATSAEVAEIIGLKTEHPATNVGVRFGYLKGVGVLDSKDGDEGVKLWRLSEIGEAIHHARGLSQSVERMLEKLDEGQYVQLTDRIARTVTSESRSAVILSKRAWRYSLGNWKDPARRNGKK